MGGCPVWSEFSMCTLRVAKDLIYLQADSEDSNQTGWMPRLIWVFAGRTNHFVSYFTMRLIWPFVLASSSVFDIYHLSFVTRKSAFGFFGEVKLKLVCSAKNSSERHEISDIEIRCVVLCLRLCFSQIYARTRVFSWRDSSSIRLMRLTSSQWKDPLNTVIINR